jgi:hypothetical protein
MEPKRRKTYVNLISQNVRGLIVSGRRTSGLHYLQMSKQNEQKERKNTYSQTSRLENPEELQLQHNHEKFLFLFLTVLFPPLCKVAVFPMVDDGDPRQLELTRRSSSYTITTKNSCF